MARTLAKAKKDAKKDVQVMKKSVKRMAKRVKKSVSTDSFTHQVGRFAQRVADVSVAVESAWSKKDDGKGKTEEDNGSAKAKKR